MDMRYFGTLPDGKDIYAFHHSLVIHNSTDVVQ